MLSLRIWAVWHRKHRVTATLIVAMVVCAVPAMIFYEKFGEGVQCKFLCTPIF